MTDEDIQKELKKLAERLDLKDLSETSKFPKFFEIDTVHACNARCVMCPVWKEPRKGGFMSNELFSKIVDEMKNYSDWINTVCLSRDGEPLLDKNIARKIKMLKDIGIKKVTLSTNASLLDEKKAKELIEAGLNDIMFSVDGATKETFEAIRKGLNFEEVRDNILRFIKLRDEYGEKPSIRIRMVLQEKNKNEGEDFKKFWKGKVRKQDTVYAKEMHSWGNQIENYEKKEGEIEKYSKVPCISPWSTMIIHFNGLVPLCGSDFDNKIILGNLNEQTMKGVWNSEEADKIRKIHKEGRRNEIPLCIGCNIWDLEVKKVYKEKDK